MVGSIVKKKWLLVRKAWPRECIEGTTDESGYNKRAPPLLEFSFLLTLRTFSFLGFVLGNMYHHHLCIILSYTVHS